MKIKILFLIHDLSVGGAEKVLVNLVNNMDREKFEITVISLFGGGVNEQFLQNHIRYKSVFNKIIPGNSKLMKLLTPRQLHRLFIKERYDIEVSYLEGPTARIISGCPDEKTRLISWIHVEQHTKEVASGSFRNHAESEKCYARFNNIVCVSKYVKKDFQNIYPAIRNVEVLYNTNETADIVMKSKEKVEENSFRNDEIKIIGVGKIVPVKGFDKLARIHKRLRDEGFPVHCYVLGVGQEQKKIEEYLEVNNLTDTFTFLGYQTNPYKYVAKCDLFVCASIAEGFSTATTEALIVGTPVVTTDVSGMKELLGDNNEYGIVVDSDEGALYEAIRGVLVDSNLLKEYAEKAKERGKYFSTVNTVKSVEKMLLEVIHMGGNAV